MTSGQRALPRLAVLASGRGSNFAAIAAAVARGDLRADLHLLVTDVADAPVLQIAREYGVRAVFLAPSHPERASRRAYGDALASLLREHAIEWVALAGFMRLLGGEVLRAYENRIVNIHPSLLPAFPGLEAQRQALEYGVKVTGCTVHLVNAGMDTGPILAQQAVPVYRDDTVASLSARILAAEHELYWRTLQRLLSGRLVITGRQVWLDEGDESSE